MIKEKEVTKTIKERHRCCDECGMIITTQYSSSRCKICNKDLCHKCVGHRDNDRFSDYDDIWCKRCWDIGEFYRPTIKAMEDAIEELYTKWTNECRE